MSDELPEYPLPRRFYQVSVMKARGLVSLFGLRIPFLLSKYYHFIRRQRYLFEAIYTYVISVSLSIISWRFTLDVVSVEVFYKLFKTAHPIDKENQDEKSVQAEVLHDPGMESRRVDVIFIHGIKGALEKTWTQGLWHLNQFPSKTWSSSDDVGPNEYSSCWPRDWLPQDCPYARIIALNYTTDPYLWRPFWVPGSARSTMAERSWEMMEVLLDLNVGRHSIIWIAHSKGGLYVKQVLVHACGAAEEKYKRLSERTKGVLFFSVPHRGSALANLNLPLLRQSIELIEVQKDCDEVLTLHKKFKEILETQQLDVTIKSFVETQTTLMFVLYLRIVSHESGNTEVGEIHGIPLDHRNICKPKSRACFLYRQVVEFIESVCEGASTS